MIRWACIAVAGIGGWLVTALPAWATHEVDHRYTVSGSVRSADGTPRSDVKVVVAHPRSTLSETVLTDRNGRYSAVLHLHDSDAGDPITVTAGEDTKTINADFDPKDHRTPRSAQVDFGPATSANDAAGSSTTWAYGVAGAVVAAALAYYWRRRASKAGHASRGGGPGRRKTKSRA